MSPQRVRFGIVGLDGHGPVFAEQVNRTDAEIVNAWVVAAMPVPSAMVSEDVLEANVARTRQAGIALVDEPQELIRKVDGVLILHDDGSIHLDLVKLFAPFGKPIFVDKPLESTLKRAKEVARVCSAGGSPVFSASSLRFSIEMQQILGSAGRDTVHSALTYAPYTQKPTMPGWIYYAIHAVEPLFEIMGPGCREVRCMASDSGPVAVGTWKDGRIGLAKANSRGPHGYGMTVWRERSTETTAVKSDRLYPELLKRIRAFVETGRAPVGIGQSVEVIAFLVAANSSMAEGGRPVELSCYDEDNDHA